MRVPVPNCNVEKSCLRRVSALSYKKANVTVDTWLPAIEASVNQTALAKLLLFFVPVTLAGIGFSPKREIEC
jgi:hypothetical protein